MRQPLAGSCSNLLQLLARCTCGKQLGRGARAGVMALPSPHKSEETHDWGLRFAVGRYGWPRKGTLDAGFEGKAAATTLRRYGWTGHAKAW
jgi:hypothetical protein